VNYFEAEKLQRLAQEGRPVPGEVLDEALFLTGDGPCPADFPDQEIEDFVQALREEGLL